MKIPIAILKFKSGKTQSYEIGNSAPYGLREGPRRPNYMYLEIPNGYKLTEKDKEWIVYHKKALLAGKEGTCHTVSNEISEIIKESKL